MEIIFKDLFFAIDGKPSGPETYTGPIGKKSSQPSQIDIYKN